MTFTGAAARGLCMSVLASLGCIPFQSRFTPTDPQFAPHPTGQAVTVLLDRKDIDAAPPYHIVGLLQTRGKAADSLREYMSELERVGTALGCDYLLQRGAYEHRTDSFAGGGVLPGVGVQRNNGLATWQFFCAVEGTVDFDRDLASTKRAYSVANRAMDIERGGRCGWTEPLGSRIAVWTCR
jgi:hypothetical protein